MPPQACVFSDGLLRRQDIFMQNTRTPSAATQPRLSQPFPLFLGGGRLKHPFQTASAACGKPSACDRIRTFVNNVCQAV